MSKQNNFICELRVSLLHYHQNYKQFMTTIWNVLLWRRTTRASGHGRCISNISLLAPLLLRLCLVWVVYSGRLISMETSIRNTYIISLSIREFLFAIDQIRKYLLYQKNPKWKSKPIIILDTFDVNKTYRLPWNTKTPLGWVGEILFGTAASEVYMALVGTTILTFISFCLYHRAFYLIFKYSLEKIDDSVNEDNKKKMLCDLIRFHNTAKR